MNPQLQWTAVDHYFNELLIGADPGLDAALQSCADAGLPAINVAPNQGKLLQILAQICGARNILEIGTLGGYSTIWLARALPKDGKLITLEFDPRHAEMARANIERASVSKVVEVRVGRAIELLPEIAKENRAPFDLVFVDADKSSTADYFKWAISLTHPGSLIIVDNVVRSGAVIDDQSADASVQGIRRFNEILAAEKHVSATAIQTVGSKGYDGFVLARVL